MVPFTYWSRTANRTVLDKLLSRDEHITPEVIKFAAAKALRLAEGYGKRYSIHREHSCLRLPLLIQEKIRQTKAEEWAPSEIISVVHYLGWVECPLSEATKSILFEKLSATDGLNVIDLWQLLSAAKRLHIGLKIEKLQEHLKKNADNLLPHSSCRNLYSMLNAFSALGATVDPAILCSILSYYFKNIGSRARFRDVVKLANALSLQRNKLRTQGAIIDACVNHELQVSLGTLLKECMDAVQKYEDDIEAFVDLLEALLSSNHCENDNGDTCEPSSEQCIGIRKLLDIISSALKNSNVSNLSSINNMVKGRNGLYTKAEPRTLRRVLRNMYLSGSQHQELLGLIIDSYCNEPYNWSKQGNADMLRSVAYFGYTGRGPSPMIDHMLPLCDKETFRHVNPDRMLIDACIVASNSMEKSCYQRCLLLVTKVLDHVDSIKTETIAMAMMLLGLCISSYGVIPLGRLRVISKRLQGNNVTMHVHTYSGVESSLPHVEVESNFHRDHFIAFCKMKLWRA